jgi:hypothetical protein
VNREGCFAPGCPASGPTAGPTLRALQQVAVALHTHGSPPPLAVAYANERTLAQPWLAAEGEALLAQFGYIQRCKQLRIVTVGISGGR